jgi:hypothetical protein
MAAPVATAATLVQQVAAGVAVQLVLAATAEQAEPPDLLATQ